MNEKQWRFKGALTPGNMKKAMKEAGAGSRDVYDVPIGSFRLIPGFNVRNRESATYKATVRRYADMFKAHGFLREFPVTGYVGREKDADVLLLTHGHTRLESAELANSEGAHIETIPTLLHERGTDMEQLTVGMVLANDTNPLTPLELGLACMRLNAAGWDHKRIAEELGFTAKYVDDLLLLVSAPVEIRRMVELDQVAATNAVEAMRRWGDKALAHLQSSLRNAQESGSDRITRKHLPETIFKKAIAKSAPVIFTTMNEITADPGYLHLSESLRGKLETLCKDLQDAKEKAGPAAEASDAKPGKSKKAEGAGGG